MQALPVVFSTGFTTVVTRTLSSSAQNRFSGPFVSYKDLGTSHHNQPNLPIRLNHPILPSKGPTPIKPNRLADWLSGYDETETNYLINGFSNGFSLGFVGECPGVESQNLRSAFICPDIIDEKILKEVSTGRVLGPFDFKPFSDIQCSPLGLVEKKVPGEYRMIHHLSYPKNKSVNDGIPREESFVQYSSVGDAISHIKNCGVGAYCCKTDIKSAFRIINLNYSQFKYVCFRWKNKYYVDTCLQFGLSSSCRTFERFSTALEWIAQNKLYISCISHVLDDFIIIHKCPLTCVRQLKAFLSMCVDIGVPISLEKTCGPLQTITYLGYELDSCKMECRLPHDKIVKCIDKIKFAKTQKSLTLKQLQSLIGLLNFACNVVLPGRAFLRRLIDLTIGISKPFFKISMTKEVKEDLKVWECFLDKFNGSSIFLPDKWSSSYEFKFYTDASGSIGYAAVFGSQWFYGNWDSNWQYKNIAVLELYPIVVAIKVWGKMLTNKCILFNTDNQALVHVINKQTCKDKDIMSLVRQLVASCLEFNIYFKAKHLTSKENILCDLLSRSKVHQFLQLAPWADKQPVEIPSLPPYPS